MGTKFKDINFIYALGIKFERWLLMKWLNYRNIFKSLEIRTIADRVNNRTNRKRFGMQPKFHERTLAIPLDCAICEYQHPLCVELSHWIIAAYAICIASNGIIYTYSVSHPKGASSHFRERTMLLCVTVCICVRMRIKLRCKAAKQNK